MKKWFVTCLICLCTMVGNGFLTVEAAKQPEEGVFPGQKAPTFSLKTLRGKTASLDEYKGKPLVINLFASWCPPCQEEMPLLNELSKTLGDKGNVIGVNLTNQERSLDDVKAFVKQFNVPFDVLLDEKGEVGKLYQIIGIPTTLLIDEKGIIQKRYNGMLTEKMIDKIVKNIQ